MHPTRALSIRQPFAELILRAIKTVEYRTRATRIVGQRFHIYASRGHASRVTGHWSGTKATAAEAAIGAWSNDLAVAGDATPELLLELWAMLRRGELPTGVIVGSAVIERVEELPIAYCPLPIEKRINGQSPVNRQSAIGNGQSPVYAWHLAGVERAKKLRKPTGHPQPVWFKPF